LEIRHRPLRALLNPYQATFRVGDRSTFATGPDFFHLFAIFGEYQF